MTIIYVKNKKWDCGDEAAKQNCTMDEWMAAFCPIKTCVLFVGKIYGNVILFGGEALKMSLYVTNALNTHWQGLIVTSVN